MVTSIIVDDDFDTVEVFSEYLELSDIDVVGKGYNGKDAVDLYQKLKPDVVFLDVLMPDYDGFYALEKIRQLDHDAKIIMVTASLTAQTEDMLKDLNASAIIYKPYDINNIIETVHRVLKHNTDTQ
ncbi:MAG: response regulator [Thaumarchaeota archaeon]|nr:response regulator [Nitrososphaerota archaeon]